MYCFSRFVPVRVQNASWYFSGIRASGDKTLGNYSGGYRQYVRTQEEALASGGEAFWICTRINSIP